MTPHYSTVRFWILLAKLCGMKRCSGLLLLATISCCQSTASDVVSRDIVSTIFDHCSKECFLRSHSDAAENRRFHIYYACDCAMSKVRTVSLERLDDIVYVFPNRMFYVCVKMVRSYWQKISMSICGSVFIVARVFYLYFHWTTSLF